MMAAKSTGVMQSLVTSLNRVSIQLPTTDGDEEEQCGGQLAEPKALDVIQNIIANSNPILLATSNSIGGGSAFKLREMRQVGPCGGWKTHTVNLRWGEERRNVIFTMPPESPVFCIIGASMAEKLGDVEFTAEDDPKLYKVWKRTAFIRLPSGTAEFFINWSTIILQKLTELVKSEYTTGSSHPIHLLVFPFLHDLTKPEWDLQSVARNLVEASKVLTSRCAGNTQLLLSFSFIECPLHLRLQERSAKNNKLVREVNHLIDSHAPVNRGWAKLMDESTRRGEPGALLCSGFQHLKPKLNPDVYRPDGLHLTGAGSAILLCHLLKVYTEGNHEDVHGDFFNIGKVILVNQSGVKSSFFMERHAALLNIMFDSSDLKAIYAIDLLDRIEYDVEATNSIRGGNISANKRFHEDRASARGHHRGRGHGSRGSRGYGPQAGKKKRS